VAEGEIFAKTSFKGQGIFAFSVDFCAPSIPRFSAEWMGNHHNSGLHNFTKAAAARRIASRYGQAALFKRGIGRQKRPAAEPLATRFIYLFIFYMIEPHSSWRTSGGLRADFSAVFHLDGCFRQPAER
jgi:hypothetical protein